MRYVVCVVLVSAIAATCAAPAPSHAGEYTVYSCRADDAGRNSSWSASASSGHVTAYPDGCSSGGGGLVARAGVEAAGSFAPAFDSATWRFDAPGGASISQVALSGRAYRASGGRWGVGLSDQGGSYWLGGISADAMAWESGGYTTIATPGSTTLFFGVLCASGSGCPTTSTGQPAWGYSRARTDLYGARVRVSDGGAPSISSVRGSLVSGTWTGGTDSLGFDASDPVGISRLSFAVGGVDRADAKACDFTRAAPCPTPSGSDFSVDTRAIPDGERSLTLTATDTAGNAGSWTGTVYIDNTVPGPPSQPQLQGAPASQWRPANGFELRYDNPSRAGGAPLTSHDLQICAGSADGAVDPSDCSFESRAGAPGADLVSLPRPGRFRVRVRVNDALYSGAWSPWSEVLRFDDSAPGTPGVSFPAGWVNAASSRGGMALFPPNAPSLPVSGIASYLVTNLDSGTSTNAVANASGAGTVPYSWFDEGATRISVVAVSGAGLRTPPALVASGTVRKDTGAPTLSVTGIPAIGAVVPYVVTLAATGSDPVSGMEAAPPDRPASEGGFVSFRSPGGAPTIFRGPTGQLSPGEGGQSVSVTATDAAGNPSPVTQAIYTQDTRVPTGGLLPAPADSPSSIRFLVSESCAGESSVEISSSPGSWERLPTTLTDGIAASQVPAAVWNQEAPFTLRATVTDCAGNRAVLDRWAAGPQQGLPIGEIRPPRRTRTTIRASLSSAAHGSRASTARTKLVRARIRDLDGSPVAGATVLIETQPRSSGATWLTAGTEKTSRGGEISRAISNPCSQRIRVTVRENDVLAPSTSNVLQTTVHASSSISTRPARLRNGRRLTVSGRLKGGRIAPGMELTLYGKGPRSRAWVPVRSPVAVSRSGRWKTTYRFTNTRVRTSYRFRIRIPGRPDYPFASGYSPSRRVTVLP